MQIAFVIGRVAFAAFFLVSGIQNLLDISATAKLIESKFAIPAAAAALAAKAEAATGMTTFQLLAIATAVIEVVFALFIMFNLATRFAALVLLVFTGVLTVYMNDFWNMADPARSENIAHVLKNVSIMGALLMLFVIGPWWPSAVDAETEYDQHL